MLQAFVAHAPAESKPDTQVWMVGAKWLHRRME
jgi:hypothetical protein